MVATNSMASRSSLELMLDKLQQVEEQPKDIPPALPVRPVSRARLPRARRPVQLDLQKRNCEENGASFEWGGFDGKRKKKEDFSESFHREEIAESNGIAASAAESDHFQQRIELPEKSKEKAETGVSKIQKCYRGYHVRCYYKEIRIGIVALQSFIRGENARRGYQSKSRSFRAVIIIQKRTRKYLERRLLEENQAAVAQRSICLDPRHYDEIKHETESRKRESGEKRNLELVADTKDQTQIPYTVLVDLQKRVLRMEAKVRQKEEENIALKRQLHEMQKKWQQYEERMKSMEKAWQDEFTYIQECLAAAKKNQNQSCDANNITSGTPSGRSLDIPINSIYYQVDQRELLHDDDHSSLAEVGNEQACLRFHPNEELRKLRLRFKAWTKDYKSKLRDAQLTFRKLGNSETAKSQKHWWARLSH